MHNQTRNMSGEPAKAVNEPAKDFSYDEDLERQREKERRRRRKEWEVQQSKLEEHERRKQKMIEDYERDRAKVRAARATANDHQKNPSTLVKHHKTRSRSTSPRASTSQNSNK